MSPVDQITDHSDRALANMQTGYLESPKIRELVKVLVDEFQLAEDFVYAILSGTRLADATGVHLDRIYGQLLNQLRSFLADDDDYRKILEARAKADLSNHEVETILGIAADLFGVTITYVQTGGASYLLYWVVASPGTDVEFAQLAGRILGDATGAGISYTFIEGDDPDALVLGVGPALGTGILGRVVGHSGPGIAPP